MGNCCFGEKKEVESPTKNQPPGGTEKRTDPPKPSPGIKVDETGIYIFFFKYRSKMGFFK